MTDKQAMHTTVVTSTHSSCTWHMSVC